MPKGITSTTACKKLRRVLDEQAPMLTPEGRLSEAGVLTILDALRQVNVSDKHASKTFKEGGGVLLLRILLDAEVGVMSHEPLLGVALQNSNVGKALSLAVHCCESASEPSSSSRYVTQCFRLGVSLTDLSSVLMHHIGLFLKRVSEARTNSIAGLPSEGGSATVVVMAAEKKSVHGTFDSSSDGDKENQISPRTVLGHANKDASAHSLSGSPTKTNTKADALTSTLTGLKHTPFSSIRPMESGRNVVPATWAAKDAALVPVVLEGLSDLLTVTNPQEVADWETSGGDRKDALTHPASRKLRADLLWYMFASQNVPLLSHTIRSLQTLGPDVSADPFFLLLW